jgi:uncharacterized protein (TIGR02147 family)
MIKKIDNPFEYLDYRMILNDDFMNRNFSNHYYSLRAYSRDLDISVSFLTEIMKGKKDLSMERCKSIFSTIGFEGDELKYIENLVTYQTTKHSIEKDEAYRFVSKNFAYSDLNRNAESDLIMKSAYHFILHGVVSCLAEEDLIIKVASKIGIDAFLARNILKEMVDGGYFTKDKNIYTVSEMNINIASHPNLLPNQLGVSRVVNEYIQKEGDCHPPYTMAHYFSFGLDEENLPLFAEGYRKLIASIPKLANNSKKADYTMLFTSSYLSVSNLDDTSKDLDFPNVPIF